MLSLRPGLLLVIGACGFDHGVIRDDAGTVGGDADAMPDALVDTGDCYGTFVSICLTAPAPASYTVSAPTTLDTDTACTQVVEQASGPALCVIAAQTINIAAPLHATGTRALVLLATGTMSIAPGGIVDVGSYRNVTVDPFVEVLGAGRASGALCGTPSDGGSDNGGSAGGGGGAGGTFGGRGGNGARGKDNSGGNAGMASNPVAAPSFLRGGCRGTNGGSGDGNVAGAGAAGGGAVLLIAATSLANAGHVRANGMGGYGGAALSGGGGGGSGGMIVLDAPSITSTGILNANGGGGGEGGGSVEAGGIANSGTLGTAAAPGGTGNINGGDGGAGSFGSAPAGGGGATGTYGAGAGGGGAGVIRVVPTVTLGGVVSPPAS